MLTIIGTARKNRGIFRPKLFVMQPINMLQINAPNGTNAVSQEASSMLIFPIGETSDVSKMTFGLDQPSSIPNTTVERFTINSREKN